MVGSACASSSDIFFVGTRKRELDCVAGVGDSGMLISIGSSTGVVGRDVVFFEASSDVDTAVLGKPGIVIM